MVQMAFCDLSHTFHKQVTNVFPACFYHPNVGNFDVSLKAKARTHKTDVQSPTGIGPFPSADSVMLNTDMSLSGYTIYMQLLAIEGFDAILSGYSCFISMIISVKWRCGF